LSKGDLHRNIEKDIRGPFETQLNQVGFVFERDAEIHQFLPQNQLIFNPNIPKDSIITILKTFHRLNITVVIQKMPIEFIQRNYRVILTTKERRYKNAKE
jgi:hypothetical protein